MKWAGEEKGIGKGKKNSGNKYERKLEAKRGGERQERQVGTCNHVYGKKEM